MDLDEVRDYCLSLHEDVQEGMPFGEPHLVFKYNGKMFACIDMDTMWMAVKCDPERALVIRDEHPYVTPAWHFNKKHWNGIEIPKAHAAELKEWIRHSFDLISHKTKKKFNNNNK